MYPEKVVEQLRQDLLDIRIFCGRYFPFLVIPLSYMRVVAIESDKMLVPTAGVTPNGSIVICPDWWNKLSPAEKRFVGMHETLHACLQHTIRMRGFQPVAYNFAADSKVNHPLIECSHSGSLSGVAPLEGAITIEALATATKLRVEDLEKMSTEEIAELLQQKGKGKGKGKNSNEDDLGVPRGRGGSGGDKGNLNRDLLESDTKEGEGQDVQGGDKKLYGGCQNREEQMDRWKELVHRAYSFAKSVGTVPAGLERAIEEILEVKPPWQTIIRFGVRAMTKFDSTWAIANRRSDDQPGSIDYHKKLWGLVDTSGSIDEEELRMFLGLLKHEARNATLMVMSWDADVYDVLKATNPRDVARKIAPKMKGGGGTIIKPALEKVQKLMSPGDGVIVITDGDIFDTGDAQTQAAFKQVSKKAGCAIIGYTHTPVEAPGFASTFVHFDRR
jgi:predicted metal-dependent peptidase